MGQNHENDKLDWMYKGANSLVDREDYLLGKTVDKSFEQLKNEEKEKKLGLPPPKNHVEHECIPPSIRDFNKIVHQEQVDLSAKLQEDPLVAIKKQEEEARRQFLQNPIQLKKLQEALKAQESKKKNKKHKKLKYSEDDLDKQLSEKLKKLKGNSVAASLMGTDKKKNKDHLDTILMHKYNQLKDKLSQKDLDDILAGKSSSDSEEEMQKMEKSRHKSSSNSSDNDSDDSYIRKKKTQNKEVTPHTPYRYRNDNFKNKRKRDHTKDLKKRRDSSGSSVDSYEKRKKEKYFSKDKREDDKSRVNSMKDKYKYENSKYSRRSSSTDTNNRTSKEKTRTQVNIPEDNLEKMILEKLRMLRDSKSHKSEGKEDLTDNQNNYSHYDSDNDEYVTKKRAFGLVRSDGTKIPLRNSIPEPKKLTKKVETPKSSDMRNSRKKLSDKEKDELRKQMMSDAVTRDKERSNNLKKHRQENQQEETKIDDFDKNFVHRELSKSQNNIKDVESRIRSKLNNIQRSSQHMNSNFSKRS